MPTIKTRLTIAILLAAAMPAAYGDFNQWQINEVFSNSDGTIQFIELSSAASNQADLSGLTISAQIAGGQNLNSLTLDHSLTGETANKKVLFATQGFASKTGLTPDFTIADGFLFVNGATVNFANGVSTLTYSGAQLPKNGVQSLSSSLQAQTPDPTNFAGASASVSTTIPALFDATSSVLTLPVLDVPNTGVANVSFDVNLTDVKFTLRNDFYLYEAGITAGSGAATLQGATLHIPLLTLNNINYAFDLTLTGENPIVFSNLANLVETPVTTEPAPDPTPAPDTSLQDSIARGATLWSSTQCFSCHGITGGGGVGPSLRGRSADDFSVLRGTIDASMPQGNSNACRDNSSSTCATDVARYIINQFGSGF